VIALIAVVLHPQQYCFSWMDDGGGGARLSLPYYLNSQKLERSRLLEATWRRVEKPLQSLQPVQPAADRNIFLLPLCDIRAT
jgi:hypothetical protein